MGLTVNEMWNHLAQHQPIADRRGYGDAWKTMCKERTVKAGRAAADAAMVAANAAYSAKAGKVAAEASWANRAATFAADATVKAAMTDYDAQRAIDAITVVKP